MAGPESGAYGPSLYRDDTFRLSVKFSEGYPLEPPEVRSFPGWAPGSFSLAGFSFNSFGGGRSVSCAAWLPQ